MNKIEQRVSIDSPIIKKAVETLKDGQKDECILEIFRQLSGIPRVRWKDSVKQVVGLMPAEKPGLDV